MNGNLSVYEQPLNERVRAFLRLEFLFQRTSYLIHATESWDSRSALDSILDIISLLSRSDLRSELIKELERQVNVLEVLGNNPDVDQHRLSGILDQIKNLVTELRTNDITPGHDLKNHDLLTGVRQRNSIPAGTCSFDLPGLQFWLDSPLAKRVEQLESWYQEFDLYNNAINLCLDLIRNSASSRSQVAENGFYQQSLDSSSTCQLIRVMYPPEIQAFPEISGGRHRFTIRFLSQPDSSIRATQTSEDIPFHIQCCMM